MKDAEELEPLPVFLLPSIQRLIEESLSSKGLEEKLSKLSKEDREELKEISEKYNLTSPDDIIRFVRLSVRTPAKPKDRALLSKPLVTELDKIARVSYAKEIKKFIAQVEGTTQDLVSVISGTLEGLWVQRYKKEEPFQLFELYQEFEPVLFKDPRYRDHFIHQFLVFLTGVPIIEAYYDKISERLSNVMGVTKDRANIDFSWFLASSFHDMGYPVQRFDSWLNIFFRDFLEVRDMRVHVDFGRILLVRNFLEYINRLTSLYTFISNEEDIKKCWEYPGSHEIDNRVRSLFVDRLISERNHAVIGALALLDRIEFGKYSKDREGYKRATFSNMALPASLAILLHDRGIFQEDVIKNIHFERDPLTFLLIYCDTIQDWGRPTGPTIEELSEYDPLLTQFQITEEKVSATLTYRKVAHRKINDEVKTTLQLKTEEITDVFQKIRSSSPVFEITLKSEDPNHYEPSRTYHSC